jgi:hypothetical protein
LSTSVSVCRSTLTRLFSCLEDTYTYSSKCCGMPIRLVTLSGSAQYLLSGSSSSVGMKFSLALLSFTYLISLADKI